MNLEIIDTITEAAFAFGVITSQIYLDMNFLYHAEVISGMVS